MAVVEAGAGGLHAAIEEHRGAAPVHEPAGVESRVPGPERGTVSTVHLCLTLCST